MLRPIQRPLCALLSLSLALSGCGAVTTNEHYNVGNGGAVSVRVQWDDDGTTRLVGGAHTKLHRLEGGGATLIAEERTKADAGLLFDGLAPGRYQVTIQGPGLGQVQERFDLRADRRVSVKVEVRPERTEERGAAGGPGGSRVGEALADGALFVLEAIGVTLLVVAVVGILVLAVSVDGDDDDAGCDVDRCQRARSCGGCGCCCHRRRR